jgi:hypothetical protein
MALYLKPHSKEWFAALKRSNPQQAAHTQQIIGLAGSSEVCSVCGDHGAKDYEILKQKVAGDTVATIRLCDDCKNIRKGAMEKDFIPLANDHGSKN